VYVESANALFHAGFCFSVIQVQRPCNSLSTLG
jgi:hypothetical protein